MVKTDEDALICDFAETYHIYNWRSLPLSLAATLACGLRADSRTKLKLNNANYSHDSMLLATIADRLGNLLSIIAGEKLYVPILPEMLGDDVEQKENNSDVLNFSSAEAFENARQKILRGDN